MLRMTTVTFALLSTIVAAGGALAGSDYSDPTNNFRLTVPDGWTPAMPPSPVIKFVMRSPRFSDTKGNCNVIYHQMEETKGLSQSDIDDQLSATVDDEFWKSGLKTGRYIDDATVVTSGVKMRNGHKAFFVVANLNATVPDVGAIKAKNQQMLQARPGEIFLVTCTASDTGYATEESDFNIVFDSFAPLSDTPVASAAPNGVPSLTLYSLARFGGVSHVVTQDTPDLALFGWRNGTASASVAGGAQWEVCDGANYTGKCRVVVDALAGFGQTGAAVTSARRYNGKAEPRALAQILQTAISDGAESVKTQH